MTTSRSSTAPPELVSRALEALDATRVRWAVLTNEPDIARGIVASDIDLVVDTDPLAVARSLIGQLPADIEPIGLSPYDIGAAALWLTPPRGGSRVQLDFLHDPLAHGAHGLRCREVLTRSSVGARWPAVAELDAMLYEIRRRVIKGDPARLAQLAERAAALDQAELRARIAAIFSPRAASSVLAALRYGPGCSLPSRHLGAAYHLRTGQRYLRRLRTPAGTWVHVDAPPGWSPESIRPALEPLLPHVAFSPAPGGAALAAWWATEVAPVRWRPGLVVSWGAPLRRPRPDATIPAAATTTAEATVRHMSRRTRAVLDAAAPRRWPRMPGSRTASPWKR